MTPTIELICGHRSIRHFTDEPISEAQREAIINSARATSSSILVHENSYQPLDKGALAQYDEQLAEYYLTRGSNNRRDTWSDHIRRTIIKESRPFILDYLHKQGWATR
ncbi:hypothetical protein [Escherichia coli]|uniref:hypothetical protein n=1 Tax=Escherichia coli TaxID=562 RepID=UPI001BA2C295|nr:hypothetical protein [Escherichia coli]HBC8421591.1 hypothetical protein [Escherichia coli]